MMNASVHSPVQVGVVGTGNIGSRHLQALAQLNLQADVMAVDPMRTARETAAVRFDEVSRNQSKVRLRLAEEISALPRVLDVAIVATSSKYRLEVLQGLLANCRVKYLVLEKVLFQSVGDCKTAARLIEESGAKAWVNCPRRMVPLYRTVRDSFLNGTTARFLVSGGQWDLGCNAIHYLDLLCFLSGSRTMTVSGENLDEGAKPAHRPNFLQFSGILEGELEHGSTFSVVSDSHSSAPVALYCENADHRWILTEGSGSSLCGWHASESDNWEWRSVSHRIPYQSEQSHLVVEDLLNTGTCQLTEFADALETHIPLLRVLNRHLYGSTANDETTCPIT